MLKLLVFVVSLNILGFSLSGQQKWLPNSKLCLYELSTRSDTCDYQSQQYYNILYLFEDTFFVKELNKPSCERQFDVWYAQNDSFWQKHSFLQTFEHQLDTVVNNSLVLKSIGYIKLGNSYLELNRSSFALDKYLKALELAENANCKIIEARILLKLIKLFHEQKDDKNELYYLEVVTTLNADLQSVIIEYLLNSSWAYYHAGFVKANLDSALMHEQKALVIAEKNNLINYLPNSYNALANIYLESNQKDKALGYYNKALQHYKNLKDSVATAYVYNNLGLLYQERGDASEALVYYKKAVDILSKCDTSNEYLYIFYYNLSDVYEQLGDFEHALEYYQLFDAIEYDKLNATQQKEIAGLQEEYQAKEREEKIKRLQLTNELNYIKIEKSTAQRNSAILIGITIILLLGAAFIAFDLKKQKKVLTYKRKMAEKNQLMTEMALSNEATTLKALILGQESERKRIARYIHDHFGNRIGGINMWVSNIKQRAEHDHHDFYKTQATNVLEIVEQTHSEIRKLSRELTDVANPTFNLAENLERLTSTFNVSEDTKVLFSITGSVKVTSHIGIELFRIAQEALTNALKYSNASEILVSLMFNSTGLILSIKDNGVGVKKIILENMRLGKIGNGLKNIKDRVEAINAELNIHSEENAGFQISIRLPFIE